MGTKPMPEIPSMFVDVWPQDDGWHFRMRTDPPNWEPDERLKNNRPNTKLELITFMRKMLLAVSGARFVTLQARPDDADPDD